MEHIYGWHVQAERHHIGRLIPSLWEEKKKEIRVLGTPAVSTLTLLIRVQPCGA
jgi:hypothetical protein